MNIPFIKANLISLRRIQVILFTELDLPNNVVFSLIQDDKFINNPRIVRKTSTNNLFFYELELSQNFEFGHHTYLFVPNYVSQVVDVSYAPYFPEFDDLFYYDGPLGITYTKEKTTFRLWAPLANAVELNIKLPNTKSFVHYFMNRINNGVYELTLDGDLKGCHYSFFVNNSGVVREATDPYGKFVSFNSEYSVVDDINVIKNMNKIKPTNLYKKMNDAIIYETNVRDFTEDKNTNIIHKGKYAGMTEEGRKTVGGNPAGIDYLKFLGVTHIQLNPIIDFNSLKDDETDKKYNWGYDPISFFAIEGSYSLNPHDHMLRLKEFRSLVDAFHSHNMRIVMDVVFNHIYEHSTSVFEKIVPNYFFRRKHNGEVSNGSGCGNDVASERRMARRILVDSIKYFIDVFDVDGFRFDLMGLLDITTMLDIENEAKKLKNDCILYGEGWNMYCPLPHEQRACTDNAFKLKGYGFFNDMFRDVVKGPTFKDQITVKGYINGDLSYVHGFDFVFHGSVSHHSYNPRYAYAHQSINYVECHDNNTLFDKLLQSNSYEDETILKRRIKLANSLTMYSLGVPFFHMGQEIGLTKHGLENSYNVLRVNNMDWSEVDKNFDMVVFFKDLVTKRKIVTVLHLDNPLDIENIFDVTIRDDNLLIIHTDKKEYLNGDNEMYIFINPTLDIKTYDLKDYHRVLTGSNETDLRLSNAIINPLEVDILYK